MRFKGSVRVPRFSGKMIFCYSMLMSHYVIFRSSMSHYVIVQFTVLYIRVVDSRNWTRVTVSCSTFVGIKVKTV